MSRKPKLMLIVDMDNDKLSELFDELSKMMTIETRYNTGIWVADVDPQVLKDHFGDKDDLKVPNKLAKLGLESAGLEKQRRAI